MRYVPHEYQRYATQFILDHKEAAILLDMGLGKSVITLTAIRELCLERFEVKKVLLIGPLRVARDGWPAEIRKWDHLKGLTWSTVIGTEKQRKEALAKEAHIYIINRENVHWLVQTQKWDFDMVVIDELSSFKSAKTMRFRALMRARPNVRRIVGLTGTPSSNGLMDLWAEFRLLDMGKRLGRYITHYRDEFFQPDKRSAQQIFSYKPRPGAEEEIYRRIEDITIGMKAVDHLDMPECVMRDVTVRMSDKEKQLYDRFKKDLVVQLDGKEIDAVSAGALAIKLCQMAGGAVYYNENRSIVPLHDRKLDALEDLIEGMNGKPVLIAYWFKHDLARISRRFSVREIRTAADIEDWNARRIPVALIHPASAGHGLNLQEGGSTLIWFSLTWSLELYQQTNARLWRQGQKSSTVIIHHLLTEDTIDMQIMKSLHSKERTQNALIDAVKVALT